MPEEGKHRITKLAFQRGITPEQVGSEAGKRLKELFDTVDSSGRLSNEEMEEINRIIAELTGAGGVLEAPDLNMLGVTDHLRFFENFSYSAKRRKKLMRTSIISRPYRLDCLRSTSCCASTLSTKPSSP